MNDKADTNIQIDYYNIGKKIRILRQEKSLTQLQLAELADMSTNYLSHIENGLSKLSLQSLIQLINALDTTPNRILYNVTLNKKSNTIEEIQMSIQNLDLIQLELLLMYIDSLKKYKIVKK
jgi:Helix-turn-helix.